MNNSKPRPPQTIPIDALYADPALAERSLVDARSPSEFAEDHLPGAENLPVLDDAERALVGTLHRQGGAFEANVRGAALVSANIAAMLAGPLAARTRTWSPVVYCWRGGSRSWSLATVLARIGWRVTILEGGYRAWRGRVVADLERLAPTLSLRVLVGPTGTGKTRLLAELARQGEQVLDLEALASHRGSVLGPLPDAPQPSQKAFDSRLAAALAALDPARPVWIESESRKIGRLHLSDAMIGAIRAAPCLQIDAALETRLALLRDEYAHLESPDSPLAARLERLATLHDDRRVAGWRALVAEQDWDGLVTALLVQHYDPAYQRSIRRNFQTATAAPTIVVAATTPAALADAAVALRAAAGSLQPAAQPVTSPACARSTSAA